MPRCPARLCVKLAWVALILSSPYLPSPLWIGVLASSTALALLLMVASGNGRVAALLLAGFSLAASVVLLLNYAAGASCAEPARRLLFTIASALALSYMALSTSVSEAEALLGRNIVTQALVFLGMLGSEVVLVLETLRARGHEVRGPRSAVPLAVAFLSCLLERMNVLEDSLRARGLE